MNVICYGDSNTYGYDPRSYFGGRYGPKDRWVDLLAAKTGWNIKNEGMNGQEIPRRGIYVPETTDLLIVMLGGNDMLQGSGVDAIVRRMERFLNDLPLEKHRILLIAPPPVQPGEWVTGQAMIDTSLGLAAAYRALAYRLGVRFADAGQWGITMTYDGVHFTEAGHRAFAEGLYRDLTQCGGIERCTN